MAMAVVAQISDTHLRAEPHTPADNDPDAGLAATVAALAGRPVDLVLLTGDLADDGSVAALQRVQAAVGSLGAPIVALAGNHDVVGNVRAVFGPTVVAEVGAWRVVGVDTVIAGQEHGEVDVVALTSLLDECDDRPTLIALHHPPMSPSTHRWFRLIGADRMLAAFRERPHVCAVVSGHLHEAFDRHDGNLRLWGCPSSYYAIQHTADTYQLVDDGVVGAQLLTLGEDGSIACERVGRL
jgi:3',5'-cyclic-AMP phosphodiesterase